MVAAAMLHFRNPEHQSYDWVLTDIAGKAVMQMKGVRGEVISIQRNNLPSGVYTWQLLDARNGGRATGMLMIE